MTVITTLMGGLGNQMFQYAMARRLADVRGADLVLDLGSFDRDPLREYALDCFAIRARLEHRPNGRRLGMRSVPGRLLSLGGLSWSHLRLLGIRPVYVEPYFHFDPQVLDLPGEVEVQGYFQSEKYFQDHSRTIREDFTFTAPLDGDNAEMAQRMAGCESVSLHVRRGDYVNNPETAFIGTCRPDYYSNCVRRILERVDSPRFFVFSDDPAWAEQNLDLLGCPAEFVSHNLGRADHEDLRLMSLCRHNVLANSSFSWWAGWLNANPDKLVLAPAIWLRDEKHDDSDRCPASWTLVNGETC